MPGISGRNQKPVIPSTRQPSPVSEGRLIQLYHRQHFDGDHCDAHHRTRPLKKSQKGPHHAPPPCNTSIRSAITSSRDIPAIAARMASRCDVFASSSVPFGVPSSPLPPFLLGFSAYAPGFSVPLQGFESPTGCHFSPFDFQRLTMIFPAHPVRDSNFLPSSQNGFAHFPTQGSATRVSPSYRNRTG